MEYSRVINTLRNTEPILDNPEALTDRIMQKVEQMPIGIKKNCILRIYGVISGAAAAVLICLFAYETFQFYTLPIINFKEKDFCQITFLSKKTFPKISELTILEKENIIKTEIKRKDAQRMRRENFKMSLLSLPIQKNIVESFNIE
jgi:hypothetical protein